MNFMLVGVIVYNCALSGGLCSVIDDHSEYRTREACEIERKSMQSENSAYTYYCYESVESKSK